MSVCLWVILAWRSGLEMACWWAVLAWPLVSGAAVLAWPLEYALA